MLIQCTICLKLQWYFLPSLNPHDIKYLATTFASASSQVLKYPYCVVSEYCGVLIATNKVNRGFVTNMA